MRAVAAALRLVEVALLELQRREVDLELDAGRESAQGVGDRQRLGERVLGRVVAVRSATLAMPRLLSATRMLSSSECRRPCASASW